MRRERATRGRRECLAAIAAACAASGLPVAARAASPGDRPIPSTGERIPRIGLGTWQTFDVGDAASRARAVQVIRAFFEHGGGMIDSSPMYGMAEEVVGLALREFGWPAGALPGGGRLFSATKVWTMGRQWGIDQMRKSSALWGAQRFDLMQVHNLLDWRTHLPTLRAWKAEGRIRYLGVTTSHGRRHDELEAIMRAERLDFVQLTFSLADREAERRLLPLAADRGIAVIANRPFDGGALLEALRGKPLPGWAADIGCASWAQVALKYVVSHPSVTCAIPATSKLAHLRDNMGAAAGPLPDAALRRRIADEVGRML